MIDRYDEMGVEATIPEFETYVQLFLDNTEFERTNVIVYPEFSNYGENILYPDKTHFKKGTLYSLAADLTENVDLKVVLKGGHWYYHISPDGPVNWNVEQYNENAQSQVFTSNEPGKECDLKIQFTIPPVKDSVIVGDSVTYIYKEVGVYFHQLIPKFFYL